jgi:polyvinyl alcohol dehydrogenase (cytochrome)
MNRKAWIAVAGLAAAVVTSVSMAASGAMAQAPAAPNGQALYEARCKACHEPALDRAPGREQLGYKTQAEIVTALTDGPMQPMAAGLSVADKQAIAAYLAPAGAAPSAQAGAKPAIQPPIGGRTPSRAAPVLVDTVCVTNPPIMPGKGDWIGAGAALNTPRYQPNSGIKASDVPKLKVKWAFSISQGNSQPAVVGDWLWIAGSGRLYALDTKTGCVRWRVDGTASRTTPMPVKSAISPSGWALIVSQRNKIVKAFDAATGKEIWASEVLETHRASGLTGSPIVAGDQVFVPVSSGEEATSGAPNYACCSFRGSLIALDLKTGKKQWQTFPINEPWLDIRKNAGGVTLRGPAGAAIWSQPSVDTKRGLVYIATGDSYTDAATKGTDAIMAIEMKTGKVRWSHQVTEDDNFIMGCTVEKPGTNCPTPLGPDYDFGATPILFTLASGKQVVLSGQKSGIAYGMDADTGKLLWKTQVSAGGALGGIEWGISADTKYLYASGSDIVTLFDEYGRPLGQPALNYKPDPAKPGLAAIDPATGKIAWRVATPKDTCTYTTSRFPKGVCMAGQSAAPAVMPGVVFSGSTDGWFRAYDTATGKIVWKFNATAQTYDTVNGVKGQMGGGFDGNGPTIAAGTVFTTSGFDGAANYGSTGFGSNVLLAFTVDGK